MMKQLPLVPLVIISIVLLSSFTAIAAKPETPPGQLKEKHEKNEEAPGQWKKNQSDVINKSEFKRYVHMRIWTRLQAFGVSPPGLMKLLNIVLGMVEDDIDEPPVDLEDPEEEIPEDPPEEPPEEPPET